MAKFEVIARDQVGHIASYSPLCSSGYTFVTRVFGAVPVPVELEDRGDGTYAGCVRFSACGDYTVSVLGHDEQPVKGSPICIKALAAKMDVRFIVDIILRWYNPPSTCIF